MSPRRARGFTLIEVLIALAIVAVGLSAAVRATMQVTAGAEDMKVRTLALWVAENRIAEHTARQAWPAPGATEGSAVQANLPFVWREVVAATADPRFRSIEVTVAAGAQPGYVLARLTGVAVMPERAP